MKEQEFKPDAIIYGFECVWIILAKVLNLGKDKKSKLVHLVFFEFS